MRPGEAGRTSTTRKRFSFALHQESLLGIRRPSPYLHAVSFPGGDPPRRSERSEAESRSLVRHRVPERLREPAAQGEADHGAECPCAVRIPNARTCGRPAESAQCDVSAIPGVYMAPNVRLPRRDEGDHH